MKNIFNKYIVILLSFYAFWILGVPYLFAKFLPAVCENISMNSNYIIDIKSPRIILSPLPKATIKAEQVDIRLKKTNNFVKFDEFETSIRILPLLSGNVHFNKIKIASIKAESVLDKDIELDKNFFSNISKTKVCVDELITDKLLVKIIQPAAEAPILYDAKDIYYKRNARSLRVKLSSVLNMGETKSSADVNVYLPKDNSIKKSIVDVTFDNFDTAPVGYYLRQYLPSDLNEIKGIINIRIDKQNLHAEFKDFAILMKDDAKSIIFPKIFNINSKFNITSRIINFENVNIKSENISAALNGKILNYLDKSGTKLDLNIQLDKSRAEDIVNMLPPIIVEEFNVYKLKHYKFFGNVLGNFSIKGNALEPEVNGDVFINDGVLIKPIKNAQGATIKLNFIGKYLNFDVFVPAGDNQKVWVKGGVELYNVKYSDMKIWSTKDVNLVTAEEKMVPIHEILNFIIGPVPIMEITGKGNIDITVKGNRKNPHVWGVLNIKEASAKFKEIPDLSMENADAVLTFNDQNAEFKTIKSDVNGKPFNIKGVCNLYGKFDFDVNSASQEIGYLFNAIKTSTMIDDAKTMLPNLDICSGLADLNIKVFGTILDISDIRFNENLFAKGNIKLLGNNFGLNGIKLEKSKGLINFDGMNADAEISSFLGDSKLDLKAIIKNGIADLSVIIPNLNLNDVAELTNELKSDFGNIFLDVKAAYKGKIEQIQYDKIKLTAKILGTSDENKLKLSNGNISLNDGKLKISGLNGNIIDSDSTFNIQLDTENVFGTPRVDGVIQLKEFDLSVFNYINKYTFMPEEFKNIKFEKGKINLNCKIHNNKANAYSDLGGIAFSYTPLELPIKIVNGSLMIRNNYLRLNKLNLLADDMPILVDGTINDIFKKQNFDIYFNSKPKQEFIDKYINKNKIYPLKIKGDIVYTLRLKGIQDNYDIKADVNMAKDSSIYYLGATVGDIENSIVLNTDTKILNKNIVKIKEFSYDKIIASQGSRQTRLNMLKAKGGIDVLNDDLVFHDLIVKTQNPTDARIFNIIFRKPNIKQGQFTSDLKFNGKLSNPNLLGDFHIFETNIPFLDTTMKNITFKFGDKSIELYSKGEILGNDIAVNATLKNKLTQPYYVEKAELRTQLLDLNNLIDKYKLSQMDSYQAFDTFDNFDLSAIIIKEINLNADNIHLRNLVAKDFEAKASLNDKKILNVEDFKFNIANGILKGAFKQNLVNNNTALKLKAKNIDANNLTNALFDLDNQLYGDLTGDISLSCNGQDFENCMKTLNGKTAFNVTDGRMPKLGSLEYLLKAGNLLKGGLTSISINSVIDIITPLKTGEFSNIYGVIGIKEGVAENIEITTQGKDLSLYIRGQYNFASADADMEVLGMLSKKLSTMFGPLGNLSLNTLFNAIPGVDLSKNTSLLNSINKIPGIELSSKAYRKFIADIKGNIKGENYVTSFKWIN